MSVKEFLQSGFFRKKDVFSKKRRNFSIAFLIIGGLYLFAAFITNYDFVTGLVAVPRTFSWMGQNLIPNAESMARLPMILDSLFETALVSVAVSVCASIFAFFLALFGTRSMNTNPIIAKAARSFAAIFRSVPEVAWALLLLFSFGQNILTGFLALFFTTFGVMTRTFIEAIDEVSAAPIEALKATGATTLQIVFQAVVPSAISVIISWVLFMIETNIRAATLIGMLTGAGIGNLFMRFYNRFDFSTIGLIVLLTAMLVVTIELTSNKIRRVIL